MELVGRCDMIGAVVAEGFTVGCVVTVGAYETVGPAVGVTHKLQSEPSNIKIRKVLGARVKTM